MVRQHPWKTLPLPPPPIQCRSWIRRTCSFRLLSSRCAIIHRRCTVTLPSYVNNSVVGGGFQAPAVTPKNSHRKSARSHPPNSSPHNHYHLDATTTTTTTTTTTDDHDKSIRLSTADDTAVFPMDGGRCAGSCHLRYNLSHVRPTRLLLCGGARAVRSLSQGIPLQPRFARSAETGVEGGHR